MLLTSMAVKRYAARGSMQLAAYGYTVLAARVEMVSSYILLAPIVVRRHVASDWMRLATC